MQLKHRWLPRQQLPWLWWPVRPQCGVTPTSCRPRLSSTAPSHPPLTVARRRQPLRAKPAVTTCRLASTRSTLLRGLRPITPACTTTGDCSLSKPPLGWAATLWPTTHQVHPQTTPSRISTVGLARHRLGLVPSPSYHSPLTQETSKLKTSRRYLVLSVETSLVENTMASSLVKVSSEF